jgi:hypothetical protein
MSGWDPDSRGARAAPRRRDATGDGIETRLGPIQVTPIRAVIAVAFFGSIAFIAYAIIKVRDVTQIPMLSSGFLVLGVSFAAMALGALIETWHAGSEARTGRAIALAIAGGVAGLAAIGCFAVTVVLALLWKS